MSTDNSSTTAGGTVGPVFYRAQQVPGAVVIFAEGWNPTPSYTNYFEQSPLEIYPPQFILRNTPPGGIVIQVLTPFAIWVMFGASQPVKTVTVVDADGEHNIKVEQTPDLKAPESTQTWLHGHVMAAGEADRQLAAERPTTMATGEESGGGPTTMATGEEESLAAFGTEKLSTLRVGEENPTTFRVGEEDPPITTLPLAEEHPTTLMYGEEHPPSTLRVGEEEPTTTPKGEESPTTLVVGEEDWTTLMLGEEGGTTKRLGEEDPPYTTLRFGEEDPTTLAVGEEGYGGGGGYGGGNPFGNF